MRVIKVASYAKGSTLLGSLNAARRKVIDDELYFIRGSWYWFRASGCGYTQSLFDAGLYSGATARGYLSTEGVKIVPLKSAKARLLHDLADAERQVAGLREHLSRIGVQPVAKKGRK